MRLLFFYLFLLSITVSAQTTITGYILDAKNNIPLEKASVFLNNTSIGTITSDNGYFELTIPSGKFELIVSSIGYVTHQQIINAAVESFLTIKLKSKAENLEEVIVEAFDKNGWRKWGKWFYDQFIGSTVYSFRCRIKNPDVLRFRFSAKNNEMTVMASEPLIIENRALGYTIRYQLELFQYDFRDRRLIYAGFPFFEPMKGNVRQVQKWIKSREEVYYGSVMHFMRSLYANKVFEEGYEMHLLTKTKNIEKERVQNIYAKNKVIDPEGFMVGRDSSVYYHRILRESDLLTEVDKQLLPRDSIGSINDSAAFVFKNTQYILVFYKNKAVPFQYKQIYPDAGTAWVSEMVLINETPIELYANGSYFNPTDLIFGGFWAWWEKISTLLPANY